VLGKYAWMIDSEPATENGKGKTLISGDLLDCVYHFTAE
jgi:hypothetical protein